MDIKSLIAVADEFGRLTNRSRARVSTMVFNQGGRLDDYACGSKSPTYRSVDTAMAWFDANWPEGKDWPDGIPRPQIAEAR